VIASPTRTATTAAEKAERIIQIKPTGSGDRSARATAADDPRALEMTPSLVIWA
jgi:hypothetical protein